MKKFLSKACAFVLTLALGIGIAGCFVFIRDTGTIDDIPSAIQAAQNVSVGTLYDSVSDQSRKKLEMEDAVALVERSSVAIYMQDSAACGVLVDFEDSTSASDDFLYIITCFHVIEGKGIINVYVPDKDFSYENLDYIYGGVIGSSSTQPIIFGAGDNAYVDKAVTLVGGDKASDIAVLKLDLTKKSATGLKHDKDDFVTAKLPPVDYSPRRGEEVFAIGNPTGLLPGSVCAGVISYLERETYFDEIGNMLIMQIDATINPGNSGGGLYNRYGELIGITNGGNTSYEAINFAIPMHVEYNGFQNGFVEISKQLIGSYNAINAEGFVNYGYVENRRELMGFTVSPQTIDTVEYVVVKAVTEGSQAKLKGLAINDIIMGIAIEQADGSFKNQPFSSYSDFSVIMQGLKMGDRYKLTVKRSNGFFDTEKVIGDSDPFEIRQFIFCDTGNYKLS